MQDYATQAGRSAPYPGPAAQAAQTTVLPVSGAMDELENNLARLHDAINALSDRLAPVLGMSKPQAVEQGKGPPAAPTLANRIYGNASTARGAAERVMDLVARFEV